MAKTDPFDKHSDKYDKWFEVHADLYALELAAIRELLPESLGKSLEVGVGSGKFAHPLGITTGVEPSIPMAKKAIELGIDVRIGTAEELPFVDNEFDLVLMVTTICFVDDLDAAFGEAMRVLKPGRCIILGFVDKESELGRKYRQRQQESIFYREATFFSTEEVLKHLEIAGFVDHRIRQTLCPDDPSDTIRDGYGTGSFLAIKSFKPVQS